MKFFDPSPVVCEYCHHHSLLPEKQLLRLEAECPNCHQSLATAGLQMRAMLDEWHSYTLLIEIVLEIENAIGFPLVDDEIADVKTLRDLCGVVALKVKSQPQLDAQTIVERTARAITKAENIDFDIDILNALKPERWSSVQLLH